MLHNSAVKHSRLALFFLIPLEWICLLEPMFRFFSNIKIDGIRTGKALGLMFPSKSSKLKI